MRGDPGADADCASRSQRPAAKKPESGSFASTEKLAGVDVNHVGGSTIIVSRLGYVPTIGLFTPPVLSQYTMPLRPAPLRLAGVRPAVWAPVTRKFAPLAPA